MAETSLPLVVKVGGSLVETKCARSALSAIVGAGRSVVVVPGGGAFADKVRDLQRAVRFDDASAHRLAMLGMHQMAELFVALEPRLRISDGLEGIARTHAGGRVPVWVPLPMMDVDRTVPQDWSATSDTLAARLAEILGGAPLVLLKSADIAPGASAEALAADGIVDAAFPAVVARAKLSWRVLGPADDHVFEELLRPSGADNGNS